MKRVFIGIALSKLVRERITKLTREFSTKFCEPGITWTKSANLHITLKFLGEIEAEKIDQLEEIIRKSLFGVSRFKIRFANTGLFPDRNHPRIYWIGIENESGNLQKISEKIEIECRKYGFAAEKRKFHPHLTIARIRKPIKEKNFPAYDFEPIEFEVSEITIFESLLSSAGSTYFSLGDIPI